MIFICLKNKPVFKNEMELLFIFYIGLTGDNYSRRKLPSR